MSDPSPEQIAAELEQYAQGHENWGGEFDRQAILLKKAAALLRLPRVESPESAVPPRTPGEAS